VRQGGQGDDGMYMQEMVFEGLGDRKGRIGVGDGHHLAHIERDRVSGILVNEEQTDIQRPL